MQTIVIHSQKGGSGKTNLCAHLAVEASRDNSGSVYVVDTDPQGTLNTWHGVRKADEPRRIDVPLNDLPGALDVLRGRQASQCFIDTAPNRTDDNANLFSLADLVLIPVRPSPSDLWAVAATVSMLKQSGRPFLFVVTQAASHANITAQAIAALSHHGAVAQTIVASRVPYAASMTDGRVAQELSAKGPAAREMHDLWQNIKACLHANTKD